MRILLPAILLLSLSWLHAQTPKETVKEQFAKRTARLWSLQPVTKPPVPAGVTTSTNPIDAFIAADYKAKVCALPVRQTNSRSFAACTWT